MKLWKNDEYRLKDEWAGITELDDFEDDEIKNMKVGNQRWRTANLQKNGVTV
jgi:hypothetical protein